jgi:iron(III) transport system ATP-binding protein
MALLQLQDIEKQYRRGDQFAVRGLTLGVEEGEIMALVGESGSGKTTLLRLIAGLEHPDAGTIRLGERLLAQGRRAVPANERQVGMVFQDYALFPHLSILENVLFGLPRRLAGREQVARNALNLVDIQEDERKFPHQLSGGQQQRVALARALAPGPRLLLLDEPFSNLDTLLKDQVRQEIRLIIQRAGITTILVTHDTRDALSTADRIAILHQGRLQQLDTPRELYEQPLNEYVADFFGKQNRIAVRAVAGGYETSFGILNDERASTDQIPLLLCFRPEHAQCGAGQLSGRVHSLSYLGDHQLLRVESPSGEAVYLRAGADVIFSPGNDLRFGLRSYQLR